jgi:hypothetical protein
MAAIFAAVANRMEDDRFSNGNQQVISAVK